jgi:hypothetical protein
MRYKYIVTLVFLFSLITSSFAIDKISLFDLEKSAEFIVMAEVISIIQEGEANMIKIKPDCFLKGVTADSSLSFIIHRDFYDNTDPMLNISDYGIFFLIKKKNVGYYSKAYWGSYAIFSRNYFKLKDEIEKMSK